MWRNQLVAFAGLLTAAHVACAQFNVQPDPKPDAVQLDKELTQRWQVGVIIQASTGPSANLYGTLPIPTDWPEQQVRVVQEEISPLVSQVRYRDLNGVRQMLFTIPRIPAGETARALITLEITKSSVLAPDNTTQLVIPRNAPRDVRTYLGSSPLIECRDAKVRSATQQVTQNRANAWEEVRAIYDAIREHITYREGKTKGAAAAVRDGFGNKHDLTSLFIAMCRAHKVPAAIAGDSTLVDQARFEAGASAYRLGRYDQVLRWIGPTSSGGGPDDDTRRELMLAQTYFALDRRAEALPHLRRSLEVSRERSSDPAAGTRADPSTRTLLYQIAWSELSDGDPEQAVASFTALGAMPGLPDSLRQAADYGLGASLVRSERLNEAIGPLERVRRSGDTRWGAEARYALAWTYHQLGDYDRSEATVAEMRRLYPESELLDSASLVQSENLFLGERFDEAIISYRRRLASGDGDRGDLLFRLGVAAYRLQRYNEAEGALEELVLRYPQSPHRADARFWLAESIYRQGRVAEARRSYEAIRISDPDGPHALDALYGLAWCDYKDSAYEESASRFGLLLEAWRGSGREDDVLFRRGNCFYNLRRFEEAVLDYERLLSRYPSSRLAERALYQKAWSLHRSDRLEEARVAFDELERRYPESPMVAESIYWSGYSLFRLGNFAPAAERFARVSSMGSAADSLRVQARLRTAESYFNNGEYNRAATHYKALTGPAYDRELREASYEGWIRSLEGAGHADPAAAA